MSEKCPDCGDDNIVPLCKIDRADSALEVWRHSCVPHDPTEGLEVRKVIHKKTGEVCVVATARNGDWVVISPKDRGAIDNTLVIYPDGCEQWTTIATATIGWNY